MRICYSENRQHIVFTSEQPDGQSVLGGHGAGSLCTAMAVETLRTRHVGMVEGCLCCYPVQSSCDRVSALKRRGVMLKHCSGFKAVSKRFQSGFKVVSKRFQSRTGCVSHLDSLQRLKEPVPAIFVRRHGISCRACKARAHGWVRNGCVFDPHWPMQGMGASSRTL